MAELTVSVKTSARKMRGKEEGKLFRWDSEIAENLKTYLQSFKSQLIYENVNFDGDWPAQFVVEDTSLFGPVSVTNPT